MNQLFKLFYLLFVFLCFSCKKVKDSTSKNSIEKVKQEATHVIEGRELTRKEIESLFTTKVLSDLKINFQIFKVFFYKDKSGEHYLLFTENVLEKNVHDENKTVNKIKAFNLIRGDNNLFKVEWIMNDFINEYEKSIWFWTKYLVLKDLDNDGLIDPILSYGSHSIYGSGKFDESRVKILIYHKGLKIAIRHQNSEIDDGRSTQIDKSFSKLPLGVRRNIDSIIQKMEERGHALFNTETIKEIKKH